MFKKYLMISSILFHVILILALTSMWAKVTNNTSSFPDSLVAAAAVLKQNNLQFLSNALLTLEEKVDATPTLEISAGQVDSLLGKGIQSYQLPKYRNKNPLRTVKVTSNEQLINAIKNAQLGDNIILSPGEYTLTKRLKVNANKLSQPTGVISISADRINSAAINIDTREGLVIETPHIRIENLNFEGVCKKQWNCEHAVHVVGFAVDTVIHNNEFKNFDAAIKINGLGTVYPDDGKISYNTIFNDSVRDTKNPVTPIDIVGANNWSVTDNYIHQFEKGFGNKVSYGIFIKGGSTGGNIARNTIVCGSQPRKNLTSVGVSLGGGGTDKALIRENHPFENKAARVTHNVIAHCSDVGIYVNKGREVSIINNTLFATSGIDIRFPISTATIERNILSGKINARDNAVILSQRDNYIKSKSYWSGYENLSQDMLLPSALQLFPLDEIKPKNAMAETSVNDFCAEIISMSSNYIGALSVVGDCSAQRNNLRQTIHE